MPGKLSFGLAFLLVFHLGKDGDFRNFSFPLLRVCPFAHQQHPSDPYDIGTKGAFQRRLKLPGPDIPVENDHGFLEHLCGDLRCRPVPDKVQPEGGADLFVQVPPGILVTAAQLLQQRIVF